MAAAAVFDPDDDGWVATGLARGPWDSGLAHGGAPGALLAREVERAAGDPGWAVGRLTVDFLGPVALGPVTVAARVVRPGRRLQLVEGWLEAGGRRACRASAVLVRRAPALGVATVAGGVPPPPDIAGPQHAPLAELAVEEGFFPTAVDIRLAHGPGEDGVTTAWLRLRSPLVPGEAPSPVQRAVAAADFGNGLSAVLPHADWTFVNTELTVHLHRAPEGEWIAVAARTDLGPEGAGLASSVLFDQRGRIGTGAQALFVARR